MVSFTVKQNDTSPDLLFQMVADGSPVDLTGASVKFIMENKFNRAATIVSAVDGTVKYPWQTGDTSTAGNFRGEFEVTYSDGKIETFPNASYIQIEIKEELVGTPPA